MSSSSRIVASIDVGSNSIQLTIARVSASSVETLRREKSNARLDNAIDASGQLSEPAVGDAVDIITHYVGLAREHGAAVRMAGTAALRRAGNRQVFIDRVAAKCGAHVKIIDGLDEARLIRAGVLFGLPDLATIPVLCVDVGGGSTEMTVGHGSRIYLATSIAVGGLSINRRLSRSTAVSANAVRKAVAFIERRFSEAMIPVQSLGFGRAVATGGTIQRLAHIVKHHRNLPDLNIDGMALTSKEIEHCCSVIRAAKSGAARRDIPGMDPTRADHLLGGALVFRSLGHRLGIDVWTVSMSAMRTGVLVAPAW
jgi:exopolyphosphatase/guanosine-5'-triphosphate,3'-diphosphate pyrophosphatase